MIVTLPIDTPLKSDGTTCDDWLRRAILWYSGKGVSSFLIDGTTGGWMGASIRDRLWRHQVALNVKKLMRDRNCKMAMNIASGSVAESLALATINVQLEPSRFVVMLPGIPIGRSHRDSVQFLRDVFDKLPEGIPGGLYEFGSLLGSRITPAILREVLEFKNPPRFIKWTNPNDAFEALRIAGKFGCEGFRVIPSHEMAIQPAVMRKLPEFVSGALVPLPEVARLVEAISAEDEIDQVKLTNCQSLINVWLLQLTSMIDHYDVSFIEAIKHCMAARIEGYPLNMLPGVVRTSSSNEIIAEIKSGIEQILELVSQV